MGSDQTAVPAALDSGASPANVSPSPMSQQYNKVIKRQRHRAYLKRWKAKAKAAKKQK